MVTRNTGVETLEKLLLTTAEKYPFNPLALAAADLARFAAADPFGTRQLVSELKVAFGSLSPSVRDMAGNALHSCAPAVLTGLRALSAHYRRAFRESLETP